MEFGKENVKDPIEIPWEATQTLEEWMIAQLALGNTSIVKRIMALMSEEKKKHYREVWRREMAKKEGKDGASGVDGPRESSESVEGEPVGGDPGGSGAGA